MMSGALIRLEIRPNLVDNGNRRMIYSCLCFTRVLTIKMGCHHTGVLRDLTPDNQNVGPHQRTLPTIIMTSTASLARPRHSQSPYSSFISNYSIWHFAISAQAIISNRPDRSAMRTY